MKKVDKPSIFFFALPSFLCLFSPNVFLSSLLFSVFCNARPCQARSGKVRQRQGKARQIQGKARQRQGKARQRQGKARQGRARQSRAGKCMKKLDKPSTFFFALPSFLCFFSPNVFLSSLLFSVFCKARPCQARSGQARPGQARPGQARQGKAKLTFLALPFQYTVIYFALFPALIPWSVSCSGDHLRGKSTVNNSIFSCLQEIPWIILAFV